MSASVRALQLTANSSQQLRPYRFSRSIVTDNEGERGVKLNSFTARVIERTNSRNEVTRLASISSRIILGQDGSGQSTYPKIESLSILAVKKTTVRVFPGIQESGHTYTCTAVSNKYGSGY